MISPIQLDDNAPWRQRFRCNSLGYVYVAPNDPSRGIVHASLQGPTKRIFAWDTASGELRPLLPESETPSYGWLGPDGNYLYYLHDEKGSELGHIARVPFAGGPAEDLTPELPPHLTTPYHVSSQTEPYFWGPVAVSLDREGRLYVVETNRHRFQVYQKR